MIKCLGFAGSILFSGYIGILAFSAAFYFASWLILRRPPGGGFYGMLFPYITHPIGYAAGSLIGAALASRYPEIVKPAQLEKSRRQFVIVGTCISFFAAVPLLLVTGPPLLPACNAIDAFGRAFLQ